MSGPIKKQREADNRSPWSGVVVKVENKALRTRRKTARKDQAGRIMVMVIHGVGPSRARWYPRIFSKSEIWFVCDRSLPARESVIERGFSSYTGLSKPLGCKGSVTSRTFQPDDSWLLQPLGILLAKDRGPSRRPMAGLGYPRGTYLVSREPKERLWGRGCN